MSMKKDGSKQIRYAVVGLGWISQAALLPSFKNAENSKLVAIVSGDEEKRDRIAKKYGIERGYSYEQYDECLASGEIDAVYIGLPNTLHCDYTVRAAQAGIHVLCEKPMATSEAECRSMIDACEANNVKLMIAYRLHFEEANLQAIELIQDGKLGDPRFINSTFTQNVAPADNIRLKKALGGGPLWDMGIYCVNAARYLFRDEPTEVTGIATAGPDPRFSEVEESFSAILQFSEGRVAGFTCSFGAVAVDQFRVVGTKGQLEVTPAYDFESELVHRLQVENGKVKETKFSKRDQFGPELIYFSDCILEDKAPEPSGWEGLADVRIIEALYQSASSGHSLVVEPIARRAYPSMEQEIRRPAFSEPKLVQAEAPAA